MNEHQKLLMLNQKLADASQQVSNERRLKRLFNDAQQQLIQEKNRLENLRQVLIKEKNDVDALEGLSIEGLFYTILGKKLEKMDKEQQEYLAAKLRYDEANEAVNSLEQEVNHLRNEWIHLENIQIQHEQLLKEKEALLLEQDSQIANQLFDLTSQESNLKQWAKELSEAIEAGEEVINGLLNVSNKLQSAKNWGTWDMLGGGMLATAMKHSKMDDAKGQIHFIQNKLRKFQRELADVKQYSDIVINMDGFTRFADYFFDGLIVDWVVQSKISNSMTQVQSQLNDIRKIVNDLKHQHSATMNELKRIEEAKKNIVESA